MKSHFCSKSHWMSLNDHPTGDWYRPYKFFSRIWFLPKGLFCPLAITHDLGWKQACHKVSNITNKLFFISINISLCQLMTYLIQACSNKFLVCYINSMIKWIKLWIWMEEGIAAGKLNVLWYCLWASLLLVLINPWNFLSWRLHLCMYLFRSLIGTPLHVI